MKRVYVETSIPSFFFEIRKEAEITSPAVIAELEEGDYPTQTEALALAADIPQLEVPDEIAEIVETYIAHRLMPQERSGDAIHLALASWHKCDFLLTWNCKHIANANKFAHIRIINTRLGLFVPALVTPMELCSEDTP